MKTPEDESSRETNPLSSASADYTEPEHDEELESCETCGGSGEILVCCDDICHGLGECIHGDGMAMCPDCKGSGEI